MKRKAAKHLALNTFMPLVLEAVTIICGFILPRAIIGRFGSETNGLVASISQFLSIISFLELGVGSVVRFNLYKPLAEKDDVQLSKIVLSAHKFFGVLAKILLVYILVLMAGYPLFAGQQFGFLFTSALIATMSVSFFAQYYLGIVNQLLLTADQKGFIPSAAQIVTIILNTVACMILINAGAGIHFVRLATSLIYLLRPLFLEWYVRKHYNIDRKIRYESEPIQQKWNGMAQHIAAVVLNHTDVIVLTLFSTLSDVSIYNAYHLVVYGIKKLINTATGGISARIGELIAIDDKEEIDRTFSATEWTIHTVAVFLFSCTAVLIVPFIIVYTKGVTDANYNVPLFGLLITLANAGHSLRLPYSITILNAGHYKQTQHNYIIVALMNIIISIVLVFFYGLIGVAIGTIAAMCFQTVWMAYYSYRNILHRKIFFFWKQLVVDAVEFIIIFFVCKFIPINSNSYGGWVVSAMIVAILALAVVIIANAIAYTGQTKSLVKKVSSKVKRLLRRK